MDYTHIVSLLKEYKIEYGENVLLSQYTTFRIGGVARVVIFPTTPEEAVNVFDILRRENVRILVLGNGSNMLISDKGYDGAVVILSKMKSVSVNGCRIEASAGVPLTKLAIEAQKHSLTGLEFAYGIPGTLGGGIYMNAGAYGGDMSKVVALSRYYDPDTGMCGEMSAAEHEFSYRHSAYMCNNRIVLSAALELSPGKKDEILSHMNELMTKRRDKQPLEYPSAGSVFKRGNGFITAQVIDEAGLKGKSVGGAQVSEKHAGFIINRGGATARDVLTLIDIIKSEVKEKFGYDIECEVKYIDG